MRMVVRDCDAVRWRGGAMTQSEKVGSHCKDGHWTEACEQCEGKASRVSVSTSVAIGA